MEEPEPNVSLTDLDNAPTNLPSPAAGSSPATYEALWEKFSRVSEEKVRLEARVASLESAKATHEVLDNLIIPYANKTFYFMCSYCGFVALMLTAGLFGYSLPPSVLQVLVGTTAVTVIGLVGMVLTGIFVGARRNPK